MDNDSYGVANRRRTQRAALLLVLAIFAVVHTAELAPESAEAREAGGAHLQDRFSRPADWNGNRKGPGYKVNEAVWGHRCLSHLQCAAERKCSHWGWCQDKSYNGPQIK